MTLVCCVSCGVGMGAVKGEVHEAVFVCEDCVKKYGAPPLRELPVDMREFKRGG